MERWNYSARTFRILARTHGYWGPGDEPIRFVLQQMSTRSVMTPEGKLLELREGEMPPPEAEFEMTQEYAQRLVDMLYEVGVRPIQAAGNIGVLAATQAHLKDMQRLVFEPRKECEKSDSPKTI